MMSEETKSMLEVEANRLVLEMAKLAPMSKEYATTAENYTALLSQLHDADQMEFQAYEAGERFRIEEAKNAANAEIELKKAGMTPGKVLVEVGKIAAPIVAAVIGYTAYDRLQSKAYEFETTGVIHTHTTKGLRIENVLPRK